MLCKDYVKLNSKSQNTSVTICKKDNEAGCSAAKMPVFEGAKAGSVQQPNKLFFELQLLLLLDLKHSGVILFGKL